jgi:hypothetical protein
MDCSAYGRREEEEENCFQKCVHLLLGESISSKRDGSTVFWDTAPCILVEVDRCFRDAYCLHHQGLSS